MTSPAPPMTNASDRWLIFAILAGGYILVYFHRLCASVLAVDMMRDLQATGAGFGLLTSAYFYPYALMQLPAGLLADSWGPRKTITTFFMAAFVGSVMLGLAPTFAWALVGRTLVGIGVSMLFVPTMKILAEWFTVREFSGMTGIMVAVGGVGSLSAAAPLAWLSGAVGWRNSFIIVGFATLALAGLVWLVVRDRPGANGRPDEYNRSVRGGDPLVVPTTSVAPTIGLAQGVSQVLSNVYFWPLALWFFFECAIFFAFVGLWGGPFLIHVYQLSKREAGNVLSMAAVGMIVGSPLLSFLSNRVFHGRKPLLVIMSLLAVVLTAGLAFFPDRFPLPALYVLLFLVGLSTNAIVVIGFTATKELFPLQIAGTATGLVNLFPFLGGALFMPLLGQLLEREPKTPSGLFSLLGYRHAFLALFIAALIAFLASLFIRETLAPESKVKPLPNRND